MAGHAEIDDVPFIVLIVFALAIFAVHAAQYGAYIADDAGITFAYAKNLARGHGLVLNPGTDPVEGYSNFAWLLVVLPFCARGTDPTAPVKVVSFALASLTFVLLALVGRRLASESRIETHGWLAALAAVALAGSAPYTVWATAGLENVFYCALFVAAILLYLRDSFVGCALTLVVLSLTRFEGVGVAALFAVHRAGVLLFSRRRPARRELIAAVLFAALYGGYVIWHWWYFRALVPNSYLAKSATLRTGTAQSVLDAVGRGWTYAYGQLIEPYRFVVGAPLASVGLLALRPRVFTLTALLLAGVFGLVLLTGGDFYPEFRLGTLVLPLWFLLVVEGSRVLLSRVRRRAVVALVAMVPIAVMCQPSVAVASSWGIGPISMGELKPITADRYIEFAKYIRKRPITVMESDIGNVGYFTDFGVLDIGALANLEIARNGFDAPLFLHYVFEEMKPDVIHLRDPFAANANVPIALIERDYQTIEGLPTGPYAAGWYVLRDLEHPYGVMKYAGEGAPGERLHTDSFGVLWVELPAGRWKRYKDQPNLPPTSTGGTKAAPRPPFPSSESGAAEVVTAVKRECDDEAATCHADAALSRQAQSRAESLRGANRFAHAFEWYAAAWEADRRNIVALRGREDMRVPSRQGCIDAPAAPRNLRFTVAGSTVTLEWDAADGPTTSYVVEAGRSSGAADETTFNSDTTTLTVSDVKSRTYYVRVRGQNRCGVGHPSNEAVLTVR